MAKRSARPTDFRIVTLCGSKGALQAYIEILRAVSHDSGMAYVILTHRRANRACSLVKILSTITQMPVQEIVDGKVLLANHVYVLPPGKDAIMDGRRFRLRPLSTVYGWPDVFDIFLASVAENTQYRAVTVVLSGCGSDASKSLHDLSLGGGVTLAQADAEVCSMPESAVATGYVDHFYSVHDIGTYVSCLSATAAGIEDSSYPSATNTHIGA